MAVTGACLVLFVTFHVLMNSVALIWPTAYNQVCEFLGANWYALVASAGLAALFILHIVYAFWLTIQNRRARGNDRYEVTSRPPQVEWASKNMLVLGIVVLAFMVVHLIQFWAKMQWQELRHAELSVLPQLEGVPVQPAQGTLFIQMAFSQVWTPIVYIIGFIALWFHMNHGFWSMFQSAGWNGMSWLPRLKKISCWWTTIVIALFVAQAIVFTVHAHNKYYMTDYDLQEQYAETINEVAKKQIEDLQFAQMGYVKQNQEAMAANDQARMKEVEKEFLSKEGKDFVVNGDKLIAAYDKLCPEIAPSQEFNMYSTFVKNLTSACMQYGVEIPGMTEGAQMQTPVQQIPVEQAPAAPEVDPQVAPTQDNDNNQQN